MEVVEPVEYRHYKGYSRSRGCSRAPTVLRRYLFAVTNLSDVSRTNNDRSTTVSCGLTRRKKIRQSPKSVRYSECGVTFVLFVAPSKGKERAAAAAWGQAHG